MDEQELALAGIRAKLTRARQLFEQLDTAMDAFIARHPYDLRPVEGHLNPLERVWKFRLREPFPLEWPVVLGEAVHDLRSALDHAVYQLTLDKGNKADDTGFPIFKTAKNFLSKGKPRFAGTGTGPQALIEALQPYHPAPTAAAQVLGSLHELWNQDKHRMLQIWGFELTTGRIGFDPLPNEIRWTNGILKDGADAVTISYTVPPQGQVEVYGELGVQILIDDPLRTGTTEGFWALYDFPAGIVSLLLAMIGNQDRPVV